MLRYSTNHGTLLLPNDDDDVIKHIPYQRCQNSKSPRENHVIEEVTVSLNTAIVSRLIRSCIVFVGRHTAHLCSDAIVLHLRRACDYSNCSTL